MNILGNFNLLSVGIIVACIVILGWVIFFSNRKSITNRTFLGLSMAAALWSVFNYVSFQLTDAKWILWALRAQMFFAVWYAYFIFQLFYVFPEDVKEFTREYKIFLFPALLVVSAATLTEFVFVGVEGVNIGGGASGVALDWGVGLFGTFIGFLLIVGVAMFIRKTRSASEEESQKFRYILAGLFTTFLLHIVFNFILPALLDMPQFVQYGAMFVFPLIFFTFYAIIKHNLLNIKVVATEIFILLLSLVSFVEVVIAKNTTEIAFRTVIFFAILAIGILVIRSVRREVEQKEKLQKLSEDLEAVNEELKKTEKLKAEFFSFAAHQVKSPMAVIKGYATLIGDGTLAGVPQDKIVEIAKKIGAAASRTLAMVNNLLDMRKIEEGRMVYSFEELNVVPPIRTIVADLETLAKDKGLALTFEASQEEIVLNMDIQKFTQVIQNLIDNAVKYTEAGWVKVSVSLNDGKVLFAVSDSGRGISKDFAANMFTQFARDPALAQDTKGTGLGLFIAKQIVEAHGGKIWASSEGEGAGSTFSVEIPQDNKAVTEKMGS